MKKPDARKNLDIHLARKQVLSPIANVEPVQMPDVPSEALRGLIRVDQPKSRVYIKSLPTSDPAVKGVLYNASGTVKVSAG